MTPPPPPPPLASVGVVSIGDMGLGIAKLLSAHNFRVLTNVSGRRSASHHRQTSQSSQPSKTSLASQPVSEPNPPPLTW